MFNYKVVTCKPHRVVNQGDRIVAQPGGSITERNVKALTPADALGGHPGKPAAARPLNKPSTDLAIDLRGGANGKERTYMEQTEPSSLKAKYRGNSRQFKQVR